MTNKERLQVLKDRLDGILEGAPDNPIYEEHESRSVLNYLQSIRILEEMMQKKGEY